LENLDESCEYRLNAFRSVHDRGQDSPIVYYNIVKVVAVVLSINSSI